MSTSPELPRSAELVAAEANELFALIDRTVAGITDDEIEQRLRETLLAAGLLPPETQ